MQIHHLKSSHRLESKTMKLQLLSAAPVILFSTFLMSQVGLNASSPTLADQARTPQNSQRVSLLGKVTSEDGSALADTTTVILQCGGAERARAVADHTGDFALSVNLVQKDPGLRGEQLPSGSISTQNWSECELYGDAPGYGSQALRIFGEPMVGVVRAGTIIMHRLAKRPQGFTVSAVSLAAPEKAKKAFEKGQEQEKKGEWAAACDNFKKAVEVYPRYALAWLELGRSQLKQHDFANAQQSFHQATEQDPHFVEAYVQIASVAVENKQWKELADATDRLVQLSPDSGLNFFFLNSAANFNLGNIDQAEKSATHGLRLDPTHKLPQLEYLYGMILARRGDYNSAIAHMQTYLQLSPHASDSQNAQNKLAELQKLAASQTTASR
jgi:Flp pilus assembly protein TadD